MQNMRKSGLGRGLGSLIPDRKNKIDENLEAESYDIPVRVQSNEETNDQIDNTSDNDFLLISPDLIEPNPMQPRSNFNERAMQELIDSIREHGLIQPLLVTRSDNGRYQLIVGERRWRAAKELNLSEVPVVIRDVDNQKKLELALIENIIRQDLDPIETALAYKKLIEEFKITHEEAARRVGKPRSIISNSLRLLRLPHEIQRNLREGRISDAHAVVIAGLDTEEKQMELLRLILERRLSVNRARIETQKMGGTKEARIKIDPRDDELTKKMRQFLGARVQIQRTGYRGKVIIEFFDYDELIAIVEKILGEETEV